jgi:hypothetical protein
MSEYFDRARAALESRTSRSSLRELLTEPERNSVLRSGISFCRIACKNLNPEMEKLLTLIQQVWIARNADEVLGACLLVITQAGAMLRNMSSWQTLVGVIQVFSSIARGQRTGSQKLLDVLRLEYGHLRRDARADLEKKIGMVVCLIEIIKICLIDKSANPGIVDSLLASTQGLLNDEDNIPKSVSTTFRFYVGKHKLFLDDFEGALSEMEIAYNNCRDGRNGERILFYLIPLKMAQGVFPAKNLLCKFPRLEVVFKPIIKAIRSKNLTLLDQSIGSLETHFFSILRSFRSLLIRGILREIQKMALKKRLIDFSIIQSLGISEIDVANLIRCGMLSGYISYEEQAVVLTGSSPFPLGPFVSSF